MLRDRLPGLRTSLLCLGSDMLRGRLPGLARSRCFLVVICCAAGFHAFTRCHLIVMCYVAGSQASHLLCLHSVMLRSRLPGLARMLRLGSDPLRGMLPGFARTRSSVVMCDVAGFQASHVLAVSLL